MVKTTTESVSRRLRLAIGIIATVTILQSVIARVASVSASSGSISGAVFLDKDSDGTKAGGEAGLAGVEVKAFDSNGVLVGSASTIADGTYSLMVSGASTANVRVEFTTPNGYQPSFSSSGSGTSIQFVTVPASNVNFSLIVPGNFCIDNNANPMVTMNCQRPGKAFNTDANNNVSTKAAVSYTTWDGREAPTKILENQQVGSTWGTAGQPSTGLVWVSAFLRRHSAFGPLGIGGLYVAHPLSGLVASFDLSEYMTLSSDNSQFTDASRGFRNDMNLSSDRQGFAGVGKVGIGDIEFSADGTKLYVMNLYERKIYTFPVTGTATTPLLGTPTSVTVSDPGCSNSNDIRPFGLKVVGDGLVVGVVCSNETATSSTFTPSNSAGAASRPTGYIRKLNLSSSTWSTLTNVSLTYDRGSDGGCNVVGDLSGKKCESARWHAWTDDFAAIKYAASTNVIQKDSDKVWYSQPIFSGLDFLEDGSLVLSIADRLSRQLGANNIDPTDMTVSDTNPGGAGSASWVTSWAHGDILLMCNTGTQMSPVYVQESDGSCGSRTGGAKPNSKLATTSPYREFFDDQILFDDSHVEVSQGAIAVWPPTGTQQVAAIYMDPSGNYYEGGVRWLKSTDGMKHQNSSGIWASIMYSEWPVNGGHPSTFGKSAGMGDIEILCNSAPVQIGNRVWIDTDKDGIQDPGETPVKGVTVRLYDSTGTTVLGTAITNANGEYYFASNVSEATAGDGNNVGGGLAVGSAYLIRFDNPVDYAPSGPLNGYVLTTQNGTDAISVLDDSIDSDASTVSTFPQISTLTVLPGVNDHTYDVGFYLVPVPTTTTTTIPPVVPVGVGNYVWIDKDKDGIQDAKERPLRGVVVTLYNVDGSPAKNIAGGAATATTNENGYYFIDNLAPGSYFAVFSLPAQYDFTKKSVADAVSGSDSNPDPTTGVTPVFSIGTSVVGDTVADTDGATTAVWVNSTIDAGVVPKGTVRIGDRVWQDRNGDGRQGPADGGVKGVIVAVLSLDGTPVLDAFGQPVRPVRTAADGKYKFGDLLPGRYVVRVTYPDKWYPTTKDRPGRATNSSSFRATSRTLRAGEMDNTLDFGMVFRSVVSSPNILPATR